MKMNAEKQLKNILGNDDALLESQVTISMAVLMSESWKKLTKNAQVLYLYCVFESLFDNDKRFTMNKEKWQHFYEIYPSDNGQFYKDMALLVERGFVDIVQSGCISRTKSIYRLSDRWKNNSKREKNENIGFVYIMKMDSFFKIGISKNPLRRLGDLQTAPTEIKLVFSAKVQNPREVEGFLHSLFCDKKMKGEWFCLNKADIKIIHDYLIKTSGNNIFYGEDIENVKMD